MKRSCVGRKRKFPFDPEVELRYPARRRKFPFDPAVEVERRRPCHKRLQALFKDEIQVGREGAVVRDNDQVLVVPLDRDESFRSPGSITFTACQVTQRLRNVIFRMTAVKSIVWTRSFSASNRVHG